MPNTNAAFSALSRTQRHERQVHKLQTLSHEGTLDETSDTLATFDAESEQLLIDLYGPDDARLEGNKYATLGEAEAIVNLPESAQLPPDRDDFKKSLQHNAGNYCKAVHRNFVRRKSRRPRRSQGKIVRIRPH